MRYWGNPRPGGINPVSPNKPRLNNVAPMIIRFWARLVQLVVNFAAGAQEAAKAPRLHVVVEKPIEVMSGMDDALVDELQRMGHRVERNARICRGPYPRIFTRAEAVVGAGRPSYKL